MKKMITMIAAGMLVLPLFGEENEEGTQEAMELGGSVTLDVSMDPAEPKDASLEVGGVELSAIVNLAPPLKAFISLKAEGDLSQVGIDQALIEWKPLNKHLTVVAGQHTLNNGLLSTHLISDPLISDNVDITSPGVTLTFPFGAITPGVGATVQKNEEILEQVFSVDGDMNVVSSDLVVQEESYDYIGVFSVDAEFLEESSARLSMSVSDAKVDLTVGSELVFGPATIDLEFHSELSDDDDMKLGGYYTGAAYSFNDNLELALRYDALSEESFEKVQHRFGVGTTISLKHGLFCALEYSHDRPFGEDEGINEIGLQFGLESTVKLPGFQRKTLINR